MLRELAAASIVVGALVTPGARAAPLLLFSGTLNADGGQSAPLGITPSLAGPGGLGGGTIEGDILVTAPVSGTLTISVQDRGTPGNVFEVILNGASLGTTSPVQVGGGVYSTGSFSAPAAPGDYDIGVWDFILSFLGNTSPYGGLVGEDFAVPQLVQVTVTESVSSVTPVPEPGSVAVLALALITLFTSKKRLGIGSKHQ